MAELNFSTLVGVTENQNAIVQQLDSIIKDRLIITGDDEYANRARERETEWNETERIIGDFLKKNNAPSLYLSMSDAVTALTADQADYFYRRGLSDAYHLLKMLNLI